MKKAAAILIILSVLVSSSCSNIEIVELNERLIIEAIGIDYEDGIYKVTIEGLDSFTAGNEGSNISPGRLTKCYLFQGETIGMAMNSISEITGQIPLFSQARVLIIGIDTAKSHLSETLDFFRREYTTRTDILVAVSEKSAWETVSSDFGENVSAGNIFEAALSSYRHTGKSAYTPLYRFLNSLMGETDSAYCPYVGVKNNAFSDQKEVDIKGTVVFGGKESTLILDRDNTLALMIMNDDLENGDLSITTDKGMCTFEIIDSRTKAETRIENQKAVIEISVFVRCDIPEYQTSDFSGLTKDDTEKAALLCAKKLASLMTETIDNAFYSHCCDIFRVGRKINLTDHDFYLKLLSAPYGLYENTQFNISVNVSVRRIGKVTLQNNK